MLMMPKMITVFGGIADNDESNCTYKLPMSALFSRIACHRFPVPIYVFIRPPVHEIADVYGLIFFSTITPTGPNTLTQTSAFATATNRSHPSSPQSSCNYDSLH